MADISFLLKVVPNEIVDADYPVPENFMLLGDLPNNKKYLLPKYTTEERDRVTNWNQETMSAEKPAGYIIYNKDNGDIEQYLIESTWDRLFPYKLVGDVLGEGHQTIPAELSETGVKEGRYTTVKVDKKGRVIEGQQNEIFTRKDIYDSYIMSNLDTVINCKSSQKNIIVTLPTEPEEGQLCIIIKIDSSNYTVTIQTQSTTITTLRALGDSVLFQFNAVSKYWTALFFNRSNIQREVVGISELLIGSSTQDKTPPQFRQLLDADLPIVSIAKGGTGKNTKEEALKALLPTPSSPDVEYTLAIKNGQVYWR